MALFWKWTGGQKAEQLPPESWCARFTARREDLSGFDSFMLFPPLWDHHGHVLAFGAALEQVNLRGCPSLSKALARAGAATFGISDGDWLQGFGWDQNLWGGAFPRARDLDTVTKGHPALFWRIDGHAAWVNSKALELAGMTKETPDPAGGRIIREGGIPTGVLMESAAERVAAAVPDPDREVLTHRILLALQALRARGLWGVTDMGLQSAHLPLYERLDQEDLLPAALDGYLHEDPGSCPTLPKRELAGGFKVRGFKFFMDGALGSRGASLSEDYSDDPGNRGVMSETAESICRKLELAADLGSGAAVHAIGDLAVTRLLDGLEAARKRPSLRVEHAQIVRLADLQRMAHLGVTASVQPTHRLSDMPWAPSRLGERIQWAYRLGSFREAGIPLLLGTDFPIEEPDPRRTLSAALTADHGEALSWDQAFQAAAPPSDMIPPGASTLAAGAHPDDLLHPERALDWTLISCTAGGSTA